VSETYALIGIDKFKRGRKVLEGGKQRIFFASNPVISVLDHMDQSSGS